MILPSPHCRPNRIGIMGQTHDNSRMNLPAEALDTFLRKVPMGIAIFNRDLTLRKCNEIWASFVNRVTQIPTEALNGGLPIQDIFSKEVVDWTAFLTRCFAGETVSQELFPLKQHVPAIIGTFSFHPCTKTAVLLAY